MNHAADALWWRLQHPAVRELAALLTTPPVWVSPKNLTVAELLGKTGFRLLLDWDSQPPSVLEKIYKGLHSEEDSNGHRLALFWLEHAPHIRLLEWDGSYAVCLFEGFRRTVYIDCAVRYGGDCLAPLCQDADLWIRAPVFLTAGKPAGDFHPLAWAAATVSFTEAAAVPTGQTVIWLDKPPSAAPVRLAHLPVDVPRHSCYAVWLIRRPDGCWHETERFCVYSI